MSVYYSGLQLVYSGTLACYNTMLGVSQCSPYRIFSPCTFSYISSSGCKECVPQVKKKFQSTGQLHQTQYLAIVLFYPSQILKWLKLCLHLHLNLECLKSKHKVFCLTLNILIMEKSTENLIITSQNNSVSTNSEEKDIYNTSAMKLCRNCGKVESMIHTVSTYGSLVQKEWK